jgi:hypothetical protein
MFVKKVENKWYLYSRAACDTGVRPNTLDEDNHSAHMHALHGNKSKECFRHSSAQELILHSSGHWSHPCKKVASMLVSYVIRSDSKSVTRVLFGLCNVLVTDIVV